MYVDHYSIQNTPGLLFVGFPSYPPIIGNVVSLDITHKLVLNKNTNINDVSLHTSSYLYRFR